VQCHGGLGELTARMRDTGKSAKAEPSLQQRSIRRSSRKIMFLAACTSTGSSQNPLLLLHSAAAVSDLGDSSSGSAVL